MKKELIIFGIFLILLFIGLNGCTTTNKKEKEEQDFFILSGTITNNLENNSYKVNSIEFDYMVYTQYIDGWHDSVIGVHLMPNETKDFNLQVKKGYSKYYFMVSWQTIIGEQGTSYSLNFTNANYDDINYNIKITNTGEIEII